MSYKIDTIANFRKEAKKLTKKYPSLKTELRQLVFRSLNIIPTLSGASTAQNQSFHSF